MRGGNMKRIYLHCDLADSTEKNDVQCKLTFVGNLQVKKCSVQNKKALTYIYALIGEVLIKQMILNLIIHSKNN